VFAIVHPLALVASYLFLRFKHPRALEATKPKSPRHGPIALPNDNDPEAAAADGANSNPSHHRQTQAPMAPREVDAEAVWG
jgi:hypothetical protein